MTNFYKDKQPVLVGDLVYGKPDSSFLHEVAGEVVENRSGGGYSVVVYTDIASLGDVPQLKLTNCSSYRRKADKSFDNGHGAYTTLVFTPRTTYSQMSEMTKIGHIDR